MGPYELVFDKSLRGMKVFVVRCWVVVSKKALRRVERFSTVRRRSLGLPGDVATELEIARKDFLQPSLF
jgi:hypothetical protein